EEGAGENAGGDRGECHLVRRDAGRQEHSRERARNTAIDEPREPTVAGATETREERARRDLAPRSIAGREQQRRRRRRPRGRVRSWAVEHRRYMLAPRPPELGETGRREQVGA